MVTWVWRDIQNDAEPKKNHNNGAQAGPLHTINCSKDDDMKDWIVDVTFHNPPKLCNNEDTECVKEKDPTLLKIVVGGKDRSEPSRRP